MQILNRYMYNAVCCTIAFAWLERKRKILSMITSNPFIPSNYSSFNHQLRPILITPSNELPFSCSTPAPLSHHTYTSPILIFTLRTSHFSRRRRRRTSPQVKHSPSPHNSPAHPPYKQSYTNSADYSPPPNILGYIPLLGIRRVGAVRDGHA